MCNRAQLAAWSVIVSSGLASSLSAQDSAPLSAIDWLTDSVAIPTAMPAPTEDLGTLNKNEPPVAHSAAPGEITVRPLDGSDRQQTGLFQPSSRGLPDDLWSRSELRALSQVLADLRPPRLPTTQRLLHDLLLARDDVGANEDAILLARIDALIGIGALGPARALLDVAGREAPRNFRRWFDIALLSGQENGACSAMRRLPQITPTYPARVFCLARGGDWRAAALTLETGRSLGVISGPEAERLRLFLDDQAGGSLLPPPAAPTPLDYAIYSAVGEPLRTAALPIAFSHADLRPVTGWKARIEAAERLARVGSISSDRLWSVYREREPAASGDLWDRVAAIQRLDRAMDVGNAAEIGDMLIDAWSVTRDAGLTARLAEQYADALNRLPLTGRAREIAVQLAILADVPPSAPAGAFLTDIADERLPSPSSDLQAAIVDGLSGDNVLAQDQALLDEGRTGEAILSAIALVDEGSEGNLDAVRHGLSLLVASGQEARARSAALELAILAGDV